MALLNGIQKIKKTLQEFSHEPWHFRYVGFPHSKIIEDYGFSLEEYIDFIKACRFDNRFVFNKAYGTQAEIYYVPADDDKVLIPLPKSRVCQVSGNNIDGFIITVWR